jgi:type IV pilus assembly protein PilV
MRDCKYKEQAMNNKPKYHKSIHDGFTLIEVLVTVFVLAVGILGVAGMQALGVRESGNLYFRTQADFFVSDIVDRMLVNRQAARGLISGDPTHHYDGVDTGSSDYSASGCSPCDEAQIASNDLSEWEAALDNSSLPSVRGQVTLLGDSTNLSGAVVGSVYRVSVFWDEDRDGDTGTGCDPTNASDMACTSVVVEI